MNKNFSNKIANINFYLTLIVVLIHSCCALYMTSKPGNMEILFRLVELITSIAVPTFFAMSSYLFFKNYDLKKTKKKLITRFKSLVIPYLLWSTIFLIFVVCLDKINILGSTDNIIGKIDYSAMSIVKYILNASFDGPLWYVKSLIFLIILSPVFYYLIVKLKKVNLIILPIFLVINILFNIEYSTFPYWIFIYYLVAYLVVTFRGDISQLLNKIAKYNIVILMLYFIILILNTIYFKNYIFFMIYRMFAPLFVIAVSLKIKLVDKVPNKYAKYSFFIFCIHNWICVIIKRSLIMLFGNSPINCFIIQFPTCILSLATIILIINIMNIMCPKILLTLNGGRNER